MPTTTVCTIATSIFAWGIIATTASIAVSGARFRAAASLVGRCLCTGRSTAVSVAKAARIRFSISLQNLVGRAPERLSSKGLIRFTARKVAYTSAMSDADEHETLDSRLKNLRSGISDLAYQIDTYRSKTAAALGAGVFLSFLATLAAYDLVTGKGGVWLALGITRETLVWLARG